MNTTEEVVRFVLGGGLVLFVGGLYKIVKDWREGNWNRGDKILTDLREWQAHTENSRDWEALQHQWWRDWAGRLYWVVVSNLGASFLPEKPPYPVKPEVEKKDVKS